MARDEQLRYGAGGKALRRLRFGRTRGGPYDRPLSGRHAPPELRAAADPRRQSWLSKIVDPPARILKDSASWFLSSLFRKSLPAIGPAPEDDSEANETNDIQENEEPETEELYQEKIGDQRLKAIEGSSEHKDIIPRDRPSMTDLADVESYFKGKTLSREEYTRLTELLQSRVVDNNVESKIEEERNNLTNLRNETTQITSVTRPRIYNERQRSNLDGFHGRDPAYNSQTSKRLEFQDAFELPDDAGASPAEIAKAYMGGRSQRAPNCLGIQKKPLLNENTPERPVGISSIRRAGPLLIGNGQIDQRTPRNFKFDSSWSNFSRTPYGRSVHKQNYPAIVAASPSSSIRTPLNTPVQVESEAKNSLKRRSCVLLEDGTTSTRRIRQKLHNRNSENTFRTPENEAQISARVTRVPPQSSETARKILEKLEKMVPSPKDNPEALLAIALGKSPPKLTSNMLKGPARRSTESLPPLPFELQMIHSAERPEQSNIQNIIIDKNKSKGKAPLNISDEPAFGKQKSSFVNVSNNTDVVRAKRQANEYTVNVSEKKRGFQMRVPEDSDDEGSGNHIGSLSANAAPAAVASFNASVSSTRRKVSEQAKLDIPQFGVSKSIAVSKSLPLSTSDPRSLIQSGNETGSKSTSSFSFPVTPASTITEPPPTPTIIPSPAKVSTSSPTTNGGHPAFNFGASGTTGPVFSFSTNSATVSEAGKPQYTFNYESKKEASFSSTAVAAAAAATSNASSQSKTSPFTSAAVITDGNKGSFAALPNGSSSVTFNASAIVDSDKKNSEGGQPSPIKQQKEVITASVSASTNENKSAAVLVTSNGEVSNGAASGLFGIPNLSNSSSPFTSINNSSTLSASSASAAIFSATSSKSNSIPLFGEHKTDARSMSFQSSFTTPAVSAAPSIVVVTPSTNQHASTSAFALGSSASSQPTSASAFAFGSSSSNQGASNATSSIFGSGIPASSSPAVSASMILSSKSQSPAATSGSGSAIFSASSASSFGTSGTVVPNFGAGGSGTTASVNQSPLGSSGGSSSFAPAVTAVSTVSASFSSGSVSFSSGSATFAGNTMSVGSVSVPSFGSTNNTSGSLFGSGTAPSSVTFGLSGASLFGSGTAPSSVTFGLSGAASSSQTLTSITPAVFGTAAISSQLSVPALGNGFGASSGTFAAVFGDTSGRSSTQSSAASVFLPSFGASSVSASNQAPISMFSPGFGGSSGAASSQATTSSSIFSSTFGSSSALPSSQTNSSNFGSGFGTGSGTSTLTTSALSTTPFGSTQGAAPSASFSFGGSHSSTSNLFGSSGGSASSSPFGLSASSTSTNTFGFGGSGSNSSSGAFAFGAASSPAFPFSSSANSVISVTPQFGSSGPSSTFQQSTPPVDQMDDSMAEDTQVSAPAPMFGSPSATTPTMPSFGTQSGQASTFPTFGAQSGTGQSNIVFGSQSTQSTGQPSPFQFGAQQQAPSTPNPFSGGVEFSGGFSLGAGGDKSGRKYIKAKRDKTRRK